MYAAQCIHVWLRKAITLCVFTASLNFPGTVIVSVRISFGRSRVGKPRLGIVAPKILPVLYAIPRKWPSNAWLKVSPRSRMQEEWMPPFPLRRLLEACETSAHSTLARVSSVWPSPAGRPGKGGMELACSCPKGNRGSVTEEKRETRFYGGCLQVFTTVSQPRQGIQWLKYSPGFFSFHFEN